MRDIRFRAWDRHKKIYVDPDAITIDGNGILHIRLINHPLSRYKSEDLAKFLIIEMFTGLKDKHGKPIYEGDIVESVGQEIVKVTDSYRNTKSGIYNFVVRWDDNFSGWGFKHSFASIHPNIGIREYEIIGNIHEGEDAR